MVSKNKILNNNNKHNQGENTWKKILFHPANIFLGFLLSFLVGVSISLLGGKNMDVFITVGVLVLLVLVKLNLLNRKILFVGIFLLVGLFLGVGRTDFAIQKSFHWVEGNYDGVAKIVKFSEPKEDYQRVYLEIKNLRFNKPSFSGLVSDKKNNQHLFKEKIIFFAPLGIQYQYGQKYHINCQLKNPENKYPKFDYRRFLASKKVYQVCHRTKIQVLNTKNKTTDNSNNSIGSFLDNQKSFIYGFIHRFSLFMEQRIDRFFPMPESGYLAGLLLGGDNRLPQEVAENFRKTGTTHTVAVSGSNITILAMVLMFVGINLFGLWRRQSFYLVLLGIIGFIIMIGAPASAVRAAIMGIILLYANQIGRLAGSLRIIVLVATIMVWQSPFILLYDVGFQLSFLATIGIVLIYAPLAEKFKITNDFLGLKSILLVTISAQLGVLGILLYTFNGLSLISLLANVLILPFISAIMLGGVLTIIASMFGNIFGVLFSLPTQALLHSEIFIINYLAKVPYAIIEFHNVNIWLSIGYYIIFGIGIVYFKMRKKI